MLPLHRPLHVLLCILVGGGSVSVHAAVDELAVADPIPGIRSRDRARTPWKRTSPTTGSPSREDASPALTESVDTRPVSGGVGGRSFDLEVLAGFAVMDWNTRHEDASADERGFFPSMALRSEMRSAHFATTLGAEGFAGEARYNGTQNRDTDIGRERFTKTDEIVSRHLEGSLDGRIFHGTSDEVRMGVGLLDVSWRREIGPDEGRDTVAYVEEWRMDFLETRLGHVWTHSTGAETRLRAGLLIPVGGTLLGANGLDLNLKGMFGYRGGVVISTPHGILFECFVLRFSIKSHTTTPIRRVPAGEASFQRQEELYWGEGNRALVAFLPYSRMLHVGARVGYRF